jgi:hypothetical protein
MSSPSDIQCIMSHHAIPFDSIAKFIIALSCFETFLPSSTIKTFSSMLRCYLLSFQLSNAQKETSECDKIFFCPFLDAATAASTDIDKK